MAQIWVLTSLANAQGNTKNPCNYLQKLPGGGQDKERVNLYNKCLLSALACQLRSNNGLCWRLGLFLELNRRLQWVERESPCVECVEEAAVVCGHQLDIDQTPLALQAKINV